MFNRPELAAQRAAIQAALMSLDGARILPFSPNTLVGFSGGAFGGGSNLVRPSSADSAAGPTSMRSFTGRSRTSASATSP